MTRGQFQRAAELQDEIDRFREEAEELFQYGAYITLNICTESRDTTMAVTDELLGTIKLWYDKKIAVLEKEFKEL